MKKSSNRVITRMVALVLMLLLSLSATACTGESEAERARREINKATDEYRKARDELDYLRWKQEQVQDRINEIKGGK